jgi:hypothetical protein
MDKALIASAVDCLKIRLVALRDSKLLMHPEFDPLAGGNWLIQHRIALKKVESGDRTEAGRQQAIKYVRGYIESGVRLAAPPAVPSSADDGAAQNRQPFVAAELVATFIADYECNEVGKMPTNDAVREFLQHNAVFHVWPYWREYVQSTFARAQLPQITLPMLTVKPESAPKA